MDSLSAFNLFRGEPIGFCSVSNSHFKSLELSKLCDKTVSSPNLVEHIDTLASNNLTPT